VTASGSTRQRWCEHPPAAEPRGTVTVRSARGDPAGATGAAASRVGWRMSTGDRHGDARVRRRWLTTVGVGALTVAVVAGPVLGSGQPDLATSDADRAAADAGALIADELTILDGIDAARAAAELAPVVHHPEAARLARDWAQVMADAESRDDLAACADLRSAAPGPVWHPRDPHLDLGSPYLGDIGEVVGCFADEVDAAAFLDRTGSPTPSTPVSCSNPMAATSVVGVVDGPSSEASFTRDRPDRRDDADAGPARVDRTALPASSDRPDGERRHRRARTLRTGRPRCWPSPRYGGRGPGARDRPGDARGGRSDPRQPHPRPPSTRSPAVPGRVMIVGANDVIGPRAEAELAQWAPTCGGWRPPGSGSRLEPGDRRPRRRDRRPTRGSHRGADRGSRRRDQGRRTVRPGRGPSPAGRRPRSSPVRWSCRPVSSNSFRDTVGDVHEPAIAAAHAAGHHRRLRATGPSDPSSR
jgi:hypothetical protein